MPTVRFTTEQAARTAMGPRYVERPRVVISPPPEPFKSDRTWYVKKMAEIAEAQAAQAITEAEAAAHARKRRSIWRRLLALFSGA